MTPSSAHSANIMIIDDIRDRPFDSHPQRAESLARLAQNPAAQAVR
jgi:hypothetical protein